MLFVWIILTWNTFPGWWREMRPAHYDEMELNLGNGVGVGQREWEIGQEAEKLRSPCDWCNRCLFVICWFNLPMLDSLLICLFWFIFLASIITKLFITSEGRIYTQFVASLHELPGCMMWVGTWYVHAMHDHACIATQYKIAIYSVIFNLLFSLSWLSRSLYLRSSNARIFLPYSETMNI